MLQDLQSRNVKTSVENSGSTEEIKAPKMAFSWQTSLRKGKVEQWILIILLVIFASLIFQLFYLHKKPLPAQPASVKPVAPSTVIQKGELNNISLKKENKLTAITFSFNEPVVYRLEQNVANETVSVFFKEAKLTSPLPQDLTGSAVENIQASTTTTETVVTITLKKNVVVLGLVPQANDGKNIILNLQGSEISEEEGEITKTMEPSNNKQRAEKSYNQALIALNEDNIKEATRDLQESLTLQSDYFPAQQALITLLLQQKEYDLAEKYLDQALNQRPQHVALLQLKARAQLMSNNPNAALQTLQSFSPTLANNLDYYALIAAIHQQLGNFILAEQLYRQIVIVQPNEGKWWTGLGVALEAQQNINAANEAYQRAAVLHTLDPNLQAFVDSKLSVSNNN